MTKEGWISLYRKMMDKGYYKKSEYVHLWSHLLLKATHKKIEVWFNGKNIKLKPGQMITGRKVLSTETGINESKIERILNFFEKSEQQIEQQKTNKNRLISIVNWGGHQKSEQQIEQQVNNKRTTSEQQVNTNNKDNNINKDNNEDKNQHTSQVKFLVDEYFKTLNEGQQKRFEKNRDKYHDCCDKLFRIDGYSEEEIRKAINKGRYSDFWAKNFLSFDKLRKANKDGIKYIEVFLMIKERKSKSNSTDVPTKAEDYSKCIGYSGNQDGE